MLVDDLKEKPFAGVDALKQSFLKYYSNIQGNTMDTIFEIKCQIGDFHTDPFEKFKKSVRIFNDGLPG